MKNIKNLVILILLGFSFSLIAQDESTLWELTQNGDGQYRFYKKLVRTSENSTDTLDIDILPRMGWVDSSDLSGFQISLINQLSEYTERNRLNYIAQRKERDLHIGFYDQVNGSGAYLALQKQQLSDYLQGDWVLVDRKEDIKEKTNITISGTTVTGGGTLLITDDLEVIISGLSHANGGTFDLIFNLLSSGNLGFKKNNNRIFRVKKE